MVSTLHDHPRSKSPKREERELRSKSMPGRGEAASVAGEHTPSSAHIMPLPERHAAERRELNRAHDSQRRDLAGNQRDQLAQMSKRHREAMAELAERHESEIAAATAAHGSRGR
jgi:hypothetical protein